MKRPPYEDLPGPRLPPDIPLSALLEWCVAYVEFAVREKRDTSPLFMSIEADGTSRLCPVDWGSDEEKDEAAIWFRGLLQTRQAVRYATIIESWVIELPALLPNGAPVPKSFIDTITQIIQREGTGIFPELRRELFFVQVADRDHSVAAVLYIERDAERRISRLIRRPMEGPMQASFGRFTNLLSTVH